MGEQLKRTGNEAVKRWKERMPRFFRYLMYLCAMVAGTAIAVNASLTSFGATPHEWWVDIYPYLIGVPVGMGFCCKFTVDGGFRDKMVEKHNTILEHDNF